MVYEGKTLTAEVHSRAGRRECPVEDCCHGEGGCVSVDLRVDLRRMTLVEVNELVHDLLEVSMHTTTDWQRTLRASRRNPGRR